MKQIETQTCGQNVKVLAPTTLDEWKLHLGEKDCCEMILRMRCYTILFPAVRKRIKFSPHNQPSQQQVQLAIKAEQHKLIEPD